MAGCNDECHCFLAGDTELGLDVDGLGSAESPYIITTAAGGFIPLAMEESERLALVVTDADQGKVVYELDTGLVYIYEGTGYGWIAQSVQALEAEATSTTLNQPTTDIQTVCTLALTPGLWAITAKANIEASIDAGTGWDAVLQDVTNNARLDTVSMAVSGGESPSGANTYWRPFALQDLAGFAAPVSVVLAVRRASTNGSQLVKNAKLMAWSIPGVRDF